MDVTERKPRYRTRDAAEGLVVEHDLVARRRRIHLENPQASIDVPSVVKARDRLLAGVAALREADVGAVEPGLGGQDPLIQLVAPARLSSLDPCPLGLLRGN